MQEMRVWWIPQVPGKPFYVSVESVEEAAFVLKVLADYDLFQFANDIKPDYCNAGGLQVRRACDPDACTCSCCEWEDWYDEETGIDDPFEWVANGKEGTR